MRYDTNQIHGLLLLPRYYTLGPHPYLVFARSNSVSLFTGAKRFDWHSRLHIAVPTLSAANRSAIEHTMVRESGCSERCSKDCKHDVVTKGGQNAVDTTRTSKGVRNMDKSLWLVEQYTSHLGHVPCAPQRAARSSPDSNYSRGRLKPPSDVLILREQEQA